MNLPNFLVVGAAKCGTTSLYHYLKQHPEVYMPDKIKETFFFSETHQEKFSGPGNFYASLGIKTLEDYQSLFVNSTGEQAIGEACVAYLYYYDIAIDRILQILGNQVKIIIVLRNPLDRAYSNYLHHVRDNLEPLSFPQAIEATQQRLTAGWWWGFDYLGASLYYLGVKAYLNAFGSSQVSILLYDDLAKNPSVMLAKLFEFLEVSITFRPDVSTWHNVSVIPRSKTLHRILSQPHPTIAKLKKVLPSPFHRQALTKLKNLNSLYSPRLSCSRRKELLPFVQKDIVKLQELIEQDLSLWMDCSASS
jgi:hypothetical protein